MTALCSRCHEIVDASARTCHACGADLQVRIPRLVDLTPEEVDEERDRLTLLSAVVDLDADPHPRPRWGVHTTTMLDLELAPVRIGRAASVDDVLPAPAKRSWRRR